MSDSSSETVSMRKSARGGSGGSAGGDGSPSAGTGKQPQPQITPPRTIQIVTVVIAVMALCGFLRALTLLGHDAQLQQYAIDANNNAKNPDNPFDAAHAVAQLRQGAWVQAVLFGVMLLLLAYALRRTRSASASRWAVLIIFVYTGMPFYVVPSAGLPVSVQVVSFIIGAGAIVSLLLIFLPPQSQRYFKECRDANVPPELRGQPRPGLGSLFRPRPPRTGTGTGTGGSGRTSPTRPATTRPADRATASKAKAKVRSDTESVAKGAELARSRAKASKSRRTAD